MFVWALLLIVHYETLVLFEVTSSGCNALVVFQQLLEGPMDVLLCVTASFLSSIVS